MVSAFDLHHELLASLGVIASSRASVCIKQARMEGCPSYRRAYWHFSALLRTWSTTDGRARRLSATPRPVLYFQMTRLSASQFAAMAANPVGRAHSGRGAEVIRGTKWRGSRRTGSINGCLTVAVGYRRAIVLMSRSLFPQLALSRCDLLLRARVLHRRRVRLRWGRALPRAIVRPSTRDGPCVSGVTRIARASARHDATADRCLAHRRRRPAPTGTSPISVLAMTSLPPAPVGQPGAAAGAERARAPRDRSVTQSRVGVDVGRDARPDARDGHNGRSGGNGNDSSGSGRSHSHTSSSSSISSSNSGGARSRSSSRGGDASDSAAPSEVALGTRLDVRWLDGTWRTFLPQL